jgi:hypothetical protein
MNRDLLLVLALAGAAIALVLHFAPEIDGCNTDHQCAGFCPQPADDEECEDGPQPSPTMYRVRYPSIVGVRG